MGGGGVSPPFLDPHLSASSYLMLLVVAVDVPETSDRGARNTNISYRVWFAIFL